MLNKQIIVSAEDNIINIYQEMQDNATPFVDEERQIGRGFAKIKFKKECGKFHVPCSLCLLDPLKRFPKMTKVIWKILIDIVGWLGHIKIFMQNAMQDGIFNIKLSDCRVLRQSNNENRTNSYEFSDLDEHFKLILAILLKEPLGNQTSLLFIYKPIGTPFDAKYPLTVDRFVLRRRDKILCGVLDNIIKLIIHRLTSLKIC